MGAVPVSSWTRPTRGYLQLPAPHPGGVARRPPWVLAKPAELQSGLTTELGHSMMWIRYEASVLSSSFATT